MSDTDASIKEDTKSKDISLESKLSIALGIMESTDVPVAFKHEGLKKKSASGAHRPDASVEYVQMKHDDQFRTKSEHNLH